MANNKQPGVRKYVFAPDLGSRRYSEIADQISIPAAHLLMMLLEFRRHGSVSREEIEARVTMSGQDWAGNELDGYLTELEKVGCFAAAAR